MSVIFRILPRGDRRSRRRNGGAGGLDGCGAGGWNGCGAGGWDGQS